MSASASVFGVAAADLIGGAVLVGIGALALLVDSCRSERRYTRRHHRPQQSERTRPDNNESRNQ
ncbi:MAG: hypothetical protein P8O03_03150 [Ilumatobacter sp.]|nr:hypothetical protein [Ilumatobacter sp.]